MPGGFVDKQKFDGNRAGVDVVVVEFWTKQSMWNVRLQGIFCKSLSQQGKTGNKVEFTNRAIVVINVDMVPWYVIDATCWKIAETTATTADFG